MKRLTDEQWFLVRKVLEIQSSILVNGTSAMKRKRIMKLLDQLGWEYSEDNPYPFIE